MPTELEAVVRGVKRRRVVSLGALQVALLTACAASKPAAGLQGSVLYTCPDRGLTFGLITEAMLTQLGVPGDTPAEQVLRFHTEPRPSAAIKVCSDELFETLLLELERVSYLRFVQPGHAPSEDHPYADGLIEVQLEGRVVHLVNVQEMRSSEARRLAFTKSLKPILAAYNVTAQDQVIDGPVHFDDPSLNYWIRFRRRGLESNLGEER